jgi:hypothetical protein
MSRETRAAKRTRRTITVAELFEEVDIDFFGTKFALKVPTRKNEEAAQEKEAELDKANEEIEQRQEAFEEDPEANPFTEKDAREILMPLFYAMLDLLLEPAEDDKGKKVHAKTVVKKAYDDSVIGLATIQKLIAEIGAVRAEERRPT